NGFRRFSKFFFKEVRIIGSFLKTAGYSHFGNGFYISAINNIEAMAEPYPGHKLPWSEPGKFFEDPVDLSFAGVHFGGEESGGNFFLLCLVYHLFLNFIKFDEFFIR